MDEAELRVGPHDEIDLLVVERHDHTQRADDLAGFAVATVRDIEVGLVDVRLDDRKLDARLVAQAANIFGGTCGGQHLQIDVGLRRNQRRDIAAYLDIRAALRRRDDLVFGRGMRDPVQPQSCECECQH